MNTFLQKLSKREQIMVIALVILVLLGAIVYFGLIPATKNLDKIQNEIDTLRTTEAQMRDEISMLPLYKTQYEDAKLRYDTALGKYNAPMEPELLDETITGLLTESGFDPSSLTMSAIASEAVSPYSASKLEANEVPVIETPPASGPAEGDASGATGANDPDTSLDGTTDGTATETTPETAPPSSSGPSAFAYSITATGEGTYKNLLNIITKVKTIKGLYLTTYSYDATASKALAGSNAGKPSGTQSFSLTFKLYVYVK